MRSSSQEILEDNGTHQLDCSSCTTNVLMSEPIVLLKASLEHQPFEISQCKQEITSAPPRNATHSNVTAEDCTSFGTVVCEPSACWIYTDTLLHETPTGLYNDRKIKACYLANGFVMVDHHQWRRLALARLTSLHADAGSPSMSELLTLSLRQVISALRWSLNTPMALLTLHKVPWSEVFDSLIWFFDFFSFEIWMIHLDRRNHRGSASCYESGGLVYLPSRVLQFLEVIPIALRALFLSRTYDL